MESGFININKPKGITSFGVIRQLRKITEIKKIGHAGTLDPMATGVLICAIGREATKRIDQIQGQTKVYEAEVTFGATSTTYDAEGVITPNEVEQKVTKAQINTALKNFVGEIEQVPPIFSAKKVNGRRAYDLARQGEAVKLKPSTVVIHGITIINYKWPKLLIEVTCGKGTYIRSIAHDLGQLLTTGGYLTKLERTAVGEYNINEAVELEALTPNNWKSKLK